MSSESRSRSITPNQITIEPTPDTVFKGLQDRILQLEVSVRYLSTKEEVALMRSAFEALFREQSREWQRLFDKQNSRFDEISQEFRSLNRLLWTTTVAAFVAIAISLLTNIPWGDLLWTLLLRSSN